LEDALEQLDLRRDDRCLVLTCPTRAHVAAVSRIVGRAARIVVVEPDRELAELASEERHEALDVLAFAPSGSERIGTFDAVLACPMSTMGWPLARWASLIVGNLRPGGRFVVDLPAENFCEPLSRAWAAAGGNGAALAAWSGPRESRLADLLREAGLRSVTAHMGTHLVRLESPYVLARLLPPEIPAKARADLERSLVAALKCTGAVDVVLHRSRVHGQR
jgi:SAM-dependent methyltransferase